MSEALEARRGPGHRGQGRPTSFGSLGALAVQQSQVDSSQAVGRAGRPRRAQIPTSMGAFGLGLGPGSAGSMGMGPYAHSLGASPGAGGGWLVVDGWLVGLR